MVDGGQQSTQWGWRCWSGEGAVVGGGQQSTEWGRRCQGWEGVVIVAQS